MLGDRGEEYPQWWGDAHSHINSVCGSPLQADGEVVRVPLSRLQKREECLLLYLNLHEECFPKCTAAFFCTYLISIILLLYGVALLHVVDPGCLTP